MISDKEKIELELLYLAYSRYFSRAHTIFSSCSEILIAVILGGGGIIISLVEIGYILEFNKYFFLKTIAYMGIFVLFIFTLAIYKGYKSRVARATIVRAIKEIQNKV